MTNPIAGHKNKLDKKMDSWQQKCLGNPETNSHAKHVHCIPLTNGFCNDQTNKGSVNKNVKGKFNGTNQWMTHTKDFLWGFNLLGKF